MSLKYGILGLLNYESMSGYELKKLFDKSINYIWTASLSQIYRELGNLEKGGFVSSEVQEQDDRPDKRVYNITVAGRKGFLEWLNEYPERFISPKRDDFLLKLLFGENIERDTVKEYLKGFIEDRRKTNISFKEDILKTSDASKLPASMKLSSDKGDMLFIKLILKRAMMTNDVLIKWAEEALVELED